VNVPFFDLKNLYLEQKEELDRVIQEVLESGDYILGKQVATFEAEIKNFLSPNESGNFVSCNSGTDALILSLLATGVHPGEQVITVSHTAIPTISAIQAVGAIPYFVDINPETWLMDTSQLKAAIQPQTKAIIPVHLYGNMIPVSNIWEILKELNREDISIIEDVAQAFGSKLDNSNAGTLGRFGAFSFYPTKNLGAMGDGGGVFCKNPKDADMLRKLRNYGKEGRDLAQFPRGINSRLDEIQAGILRVKLRAVSGWKKRKELIMKGYQDSFQNFPIQFQKVSSGCEPNWHLCVVALENGNLRDKFKNYLGAQGVYCLIHYPYPCHLQPPFKDHFRDNLKNTEILSKRILSLPFSSTFSGEQQEWVIQSLKSFFNST